MSKGILDVYCDGSITGGPWGKKSERHLTPHGWSGWVVKRMDGIVVHHHAVDLGEAPYMTGNVAEYMALRSSFRWLLENHPDWSLKVNSDSQLIINQMKGVFACSDPKLVRLRDECLRLARKFPSVTYSWIRRENNRYADFMSKILQHTGVVPPVPVPDYVIKEWR